METHRDLITGSRQWKEFTCIPLLGCRYQDVACRSVFLGGNQMPTFSR